MTGRPVVSSAPVWQHSMVSTSEAGSSRFEQVQLEKAVDDTARMGPKHRLPILGNPGPGIAQREKPLEQGQCRTHAAHHVAA